MRFIKLITPILFSILLPFHVTAQQTNPVDRQVANPLTDTPNINPISAQQDISAPKSKKPSFENDGGNGELVVYSDRQSVEGEKGSRILHHAGNVDIHYGLYRLQANDVTIYEAENKMVAEGSVIFDKGDDQRITGAKAIWNYKTKLGSFEDSTGFSNQTKDGTVLYFTAEKVELVGSDELIVTNGSFTACDEAVPKWSFSAKSARIKTNDRVWLKTGKFRIKGIAIAAVPFASIPIKKKDRSSGFLTPSVGYSQRKGVRISNAYYQTLGDSADLTIRGDIYTARGVGYGADFRARTNSRSFFNIGFFGVKDRIFGHKADAGHPDQGGISIYAEGAQYFSNGWTAAVDVRLTSSLAFRQVFSDGIQQVISPIEVSQVFLNKSWNNYSLDLLARTQDITIPNVKERTRNLPSFNFERRPSMLSFLKGVYFSFNASIEGVSRREQVDDINLYRQETGSDPIVTGLGTRLDFYPELMIPLHTKYFNFTFTGGGRVTRYSDSFNDMRQVVGNSIVRKDGEFTFDVRPVALAKNFYAKDNQFRFRHVIEPYLTYRLVKGIDNFARIIRFDYVDTITDTNEIEFGVTNRFYTRKYTEAVSSDAKKRLLAESTGKKNELSIQPYEILSVTVRGKYFIDKTFGGALIPGRRNEIEPITALTFYSFGGVPRRFSPLSIDAIYRPQKTVFFSSRLDYGMQGDGLRDISATVGYNRSLFKLFQTFYYTRAVTLIPSLAQYSNAAGKEPGTIRGSQMSPSVFLGNRDHGLYGGASFFFDFENRRVTKLSPAITTLYTLGYTYNCCSMVVQYSTFRVGVRSENRFVFTFRLNGIGTFGTEQIGQGSR